MAYRVCMATGRSKVLLTHPTSCKLDASDPHPRSILSILLMPDMCSKSCVCYALSNL